MLRKKKFLEELGGCIVISGCCLAEIDILVYAETEKNNKKKQKKTKQHNFPMSKIIIVISSLNNQNNPKCVSLRAYSLCIDLENCKLLDN